MSVLPHFTVCIDKSLRHFTTTFDSLVSSLFRDFFHFLIATHHNLVVIDPRETWHNRFTRLGEVRRRFGLLPRLLERGEFC